MPVRQFQAGHTYNITFDFYSDLGTPTPVEDYPTLLLFNPYKKLEVSGLTLTSLAGVTGRYEREYFMPVGMSVGTWFFIATGLTQTDRTLISKQLVFEVIDLGTSFGWISLEEFRDFLSCDPLDRDNDSTLQQVLTAAVQLIEQLTKRTFGLHDVSESFWIPEGNTSYVLKQAPILQITGLTAGTVVQTLTPNNLTVAGITTSLSDFNFLLDDHNGVLRFTDTYGYPYCYQNVYVEIDYVAGESTVPALIRQHTLSIASKILNKMTAEGLDAIKFADLSYSFSKGILDQDTVQMLELYKHTAIR